MARTYHAEGRQVKNVLIVLFVGFILGAYYFIRFHLGVFIGLLVGAFVIAELLGSIWTIRRRKAAKARKRTKSSRARKTGSQVRSDEEILSSSFEELNGYEFEKLLALYFRDQGYRVQEVGVGGSDGGVDLVIMDQSGENTAVQAKCYSDHHLVSVRPVRELVGAKRNHNCMLSLLVTTSDLTLPAKKEAEQLKVDYWHGALLEQKLKAWGKWKPGGKKKNAR